MATIATWNLQRPKKGPSAKKNRQLAKMKTIDADLWILTETNTVITLDGYKAISSNHARNYHSEGEACVTILTRWEILRPIATNDPELAVCAEVRSPYGPMIVYGSIIPYANWQGREGKSGRWVEHRKSIESHSKDWLDLHRKFPKHHFCFAGDYNQSRDGSGWYEDPPSVKALTEALDRCCTACVTECNFRHMGLLKFRSSVDHICLSPGLVERVLNVGAWEGTEDGMQMSDHNGVFVGLNRDPASTDRDAMGTRDDNATPAELILEVAAEGGGIRLYGQRHAGGWRFRRDVRDQTPGLLDEPWIEHSVGMVTEWAEALDLLDQYPWHQLSPIKVHEEFKARLLAAVVERYGGAGDRPWSTLSRWKRVCAP